MIGECQRTIQPKLGHTVLTWIAHLNLRSLTSETMNL